MNNEKRTYFDLSLIVYLLYPSIIYAYFLGFLHLYFLIFQSFITVLLLPVFITILFNIKAIRNRFLLTCSLLTILVAILYYWKTGYFGHNQDHFIVMYALAVIPIYPVIILYFSRVASDDNFEKYLQVKQNKS